MRSSTPSPSPERLAVRLFSVLREIVGRSSLEMRLDKPQEVRLVLDRLVAEHPRMAPHRNSMRVAVNQEYVSEAFSVYNGDELAIITPVSGG